MLCLKGIEVALQAPDSGPCISEVIEPASVTIRGSAALLVLQKKLPSILGVEDESTLLTSD